jgi:succinate dehydrogenase / fumarate reductase iron-sulfur subunit
MLLDALVRIKTIDDTLALRRSCREGVCGSDAMNINGKNGLACTTKLVDLKEPVVIKPLPGLPIIRDLIVDMTQFFAQYHSVKPYRERRRRRPRRSGCRARTSARSSTASTNASCARAARPRARASGGTPTSSWARGLLQAYRFIADSRDQATNERLDDLEDPYRLFRCHTIMNCVDVCPKGLNPTLAIGKIKEMLVRRAV